MESKWDAVSASSVAKRTSNPIRNIVDRLNIVPHPSDPTVFGNMNPPDEALSAMIAQVSSLKSNGYPPSHGYEATRHAVAHHYSCKEAPLSASDVIIASGCSGALDLAISVLADEGDNILLPRPGFSLYQTLMESKGIECRYYDLLPANSWQIDLEHVATLVDQKTKCILVNNPSNPCGSVFSREHILDILALANKLRLPLIADEIYADMVFLPTVYHSFASLSTNVPILSVGGLAKRFLVPGWRLGWILIHGRVKIRNGLLALSALILGANSVVQAALPVILKETPASFYTSTNAFLASQARLSMKILGQVVGLEAIVPQGAMYLMIRINIASFKDISNDMEFTQKLVHEESVLCLPGECFKCPNYFRIVFTAPPEHLTTALNRIKTFCENHAK